MLATWILGTLFFVFIIAFIVYVLRVEVSQPQPVKCDDSSVRDPLPVGPEPVDKGPYRISRDYRIAMSVQAFVNYPFGLTVVFPAAGQAAPTGDAQAGAQRGFQESDYYGWPRSGQPDPQLVVESGRIEFEDNDPVPAVRVDLQFDKALFEARSASGTQTLEQDREIVYPFWLNPLTEQESSVTLVFSRDTPPAAGGREQRPAARDEKPARELAVVTRPVKVTHFPIRLR